MLLNEGKEVRHADIQADRLDQDVGPGRVHLVDHGQAGPDLRAVIREGATIDTGAEHDRPPRS